MRIIRFAASMIALSVIMAIAVEGQFFYSGNGPTPLVVDSNRVTIHLGMESAEDSGSVIDSIGRIAQILEDDNAIDGFVVCSLSTPIGYSGFLDSLDALSGIYLVEPYYRDTAGSPFLVGEFMCAAFSNELTEQQIDSICTEYGAVIDSPVPHMGHVYAIRNTDSSGLRILDLANLFYDLPVTLYSHPVFSVRPEMFSYNLWD